MGPFGSRIKKENFTNSGIPVIKGGNLNGDFILEDNFDYLTIDKADELSTSNAFKRDIVITHRGTIGQVGIIPDNSKYERYVVSQSQLKVSLDESRVNPFFVYYFLRSPIGQHRLLSNASQVGVPAIAQASTSVKSILVPVPKIEVQNKVVEILLNLDHKIEANQQTNETLEAMAQAIFKSWFVDFDPVRAKIAAKKAGRDPEKAAMAAISGVSLEMDWDEIESTLQQKLNHMTGDQAAQLRHTASLFPDELVDSELGEVPKGWGVKSLDKIADFLNGKAMQKYPPEDGKPTLPVLKIAQLRKSDTEGADIATADIPERFQIRNGDMIFSWSGSLLIRLWAGGDAALNQHLFKVTSEEYDQWFYYHWTKFHLDNFIRIAESKAVTMGHIKRSHLKEAKCAIPDKELLEIGGQQIKPLLQQSMKLNLESNNLAELRDTLLPKLISGELEVHAKENI